MIHAFSASELLTVWEQGIGQSHVAKALALLALAAPEAARETFAALSIGRRDAQLLALRERLFGSHLVSVAVCPQCAQRLELTVQMADIRADTGEPQPQTLHVEADGYEATFRLPNSEDLINVQSGYTRAEEVSAASHALLSRCLLQVRHADHEPQSGAEVPITDLSPALMTAITAAMEQADPQANVSLRLTCTECGHCWSAAFDITAYLWGEINDWAHRILREVHVLASTYGWRETDILQLSARRRQMYLQMLGL